MNYVTVFGFGSFFLDKNVSNDIDILLVHEDTSVGSCTFVLRCKKSLWQAIRSAHITALSHSEEYDFNFIGTAKALRIGAIKSGSFERDIAMICRQLTSRLKLYS